MFFDGWHDLLHILVVGGGAYFGLVVLLRITGKRTLSKLNAFDLVVTVALGSTLASALLSSDVTLSEGLLAFVLLCGLQYAVTFASLHSKGFRRLIKSEPSLLFFDGAFLDGQMRKERLTRDEVMAAMRSSGKHDPAEVAAVILETDGSISVIGAGGGLGGTLASVNGIEHAAA